jgi:hypothetical protein
MKIRIRCSKVMRHPSSDEFGECWWSELAAMPSQSPTLTTSGLTVVFKGPPLIQAGDEYELDLQKVPQEHK